MSLDAARVAHNKERKRQLSTYTLESGVTVEVASRIFHPESTQDTESEKFEPAVVFLPGWAMGVNKKSIEKLCETFAKEQGSETHALTTRSQERGGSHEHPDLLYEEARALKEYLLEKNIKNIILAGHSQGAEKAIDLATLIQHDKNFKCIGVLLIDAVGLYAQGEVELAVEFAKNSAIDTPGSVARGIIAASLKGKPKVRPALRAGIDVGAGILDEARRSKISYWDRFKSEVKEMAKKNPHMSEITVPIVIISGKNDTVSDTERIIPNREIESRKTKLSLETEDMTESRAQGLTQAVREKYLQENLFTQSPYVRMLVPTKLGVHALPFLRPESVVRASLFMLKRYWKTVE